MKGEINDFLQYLLHEIRTPLTAIKGALDLLERGTFGQLNPTQLELLDISNDGMAKLLILTNQILDLSKSEYDSFNLTKVEVDIDSLSEEAFQFMKALFDEKDQQVFLKLEAGTSIQIDKQLILQVLLNLLSNSNKYTQEGGMITLRTYVRNNRLHVEIRDNGIGISTENQKNLFKKFYRVDEQIDGTGLGLFICKQTIESHGGRIWVESNQGGGSVFAFAIPLAVNLNGVLNFREV